MGRFARAEEIANAALFLASDESSYVNAAGVPGRRRDQRGVHDAAWWNGWGEIGWRRFLGNARRGAAQARQVATAAASPAELAYPGHCEHLTGQRGAHAEQRPGHGILEEIRVQQRVEHQRRKRGPDRRPHRVPARGAEQRDQRPRSPTRDRPAPDQALLGADRDRNRVRCRQGLRGAAVVGAVLLDERARPVAPEGRSPNSATPPLTSPPRPLEAPFRPWLSPNVVGEIATAAAPSAITASATHQRPRRASSAAPPTRPGRPAARRGSSVRASGRAPPQDGQHHHGP